MKGEPTGVKGVKLSTPPRLGLIKAEYPNELKLADVTPIFKKKNPSRALNSRPVSVLDSVSKTFERIL